MFLANAKLLKVFWPNSSRKQKMVDIMPILYLHVSFFLKTK